MDFSTNVRVECATFARALFLTKKQARIMGMCFFMITLFSFQSFSHSGWTLLKSESGVSVYYQVTDCPEAMDPTVVPAPATIPQKMELKIVNNSGSDVQIEFFRDIKLSGNDALQNVSAAAGETLITDCATTPQVKLTETEGDDRPVALADFLEAFELTIKP